MTATILVLLLRFLVQPSGSSIAQTPAASGAARGAIEGTVVRADSTTPVVRARILLARIDGRLADSVVGLTNESGRFLLGNVAPGRYRLFVEHDDYVRQEYSTPITIIVGQTLTNVSLALTALSTISGRVVNEFGDPASRIFVRALGSRVVAEAKTNDLGEYRLFGLAPGTYVIAAERYPGPRIEEQTAGPAVGRGLYYIVPGPPSPDSPGEGRAMQILTGLLKGGGFVDPFALTGRTYPPVFYPGTIDRSTAQPLIVGAGASLSGIDLQLVVRPGGP